MAAKNLTARRVTALKPRLTRYEIFDSRTPGLAIRVTPTGHKSWVLHYRHRGRHRRLTLGRYPDRTLAAARAKAIKERARILDGADPAAEKRAERTRSGESVAALYELYKNASENKRSWPEQRRIFE